MPKLGNSTNSKRSSQDDDTAPAASLAAKRVKKGASSEDDAKPKEATAASMNPHDAFFAKKDKFCEDHGFLGSMIVRGMPRDANAEQDDQDGEDKDTSKYTTAQMDHLRFILIDEARNDSLDKMRDFVLGEQANEDGMLFFNTSFSYEILDGFTAFRNKYNRVKSPSAKLNMLFAYTYNLKDFNVWMHDNEGGMDVMVKALASMWKKLLKKSNEELGTDVEYSKPGILDFLEQFKTAVAGMPTYDDSTIQFKYK